MSTATAWYGNYSMPKLAELIVYKFGSVASFADYIGKTRQSVYNVLSGRTDINRSAIMEWANVLGIHTNMIDAYFF